MNHHRPIAKKKPARNRDPRVKAGEAIGELLAIGRGADMADCITGLSGADCRVGRALDGFFLRFLDKQDPGKLTFDQGMQIVEAIVSVTTAATLAHEAGIKPDLSGTGQEPRVIYDPTDDEPLVPAMKGALDMFRKHGED